MSIAQIFYLGSWNVLNLKYNINDKWSVFDETQLRSLKFYKNTTLLLGASSYQTCKEDGNFILPKNSDEFRIWPQIIFFQSLGKIKIEWRYRAELRFTSNGYRNRFRYRLGLSYTSGKERNNFKPLQIIVSNKLFFTDKEPYFERNRMLVAFNYKP